MADETDNKTIDNGTHIDQAFVDGNRTKSPLPHAEHLLEEHTTPSSHPLVPGDFQPQGGSIDNRPPSRRSSDSVNTDIELEVLQQEDPLYGNGGTHLRNRNSLGEAKADDRVETSEPNSNMESLTREKEARRLGNKQFIQKTLINCILIALWYILSISMSVYNKWMFSPGNLDFHFPLFSTSVHMVVQFFLASIILYFFPQFRPRNGAVDPHDAEESPQQREPEDPSKPLMTPWFYLTRIASCGTVTGLDIGLGNTSLKFISLTFFTMVKSSTLGFVLGFAILFRLEAPSWKIGGIIAVMTLGVILMVSGETAFDGIGFALLMAASFFSGLRWSLTQILLRRTPATSNPFSTLFFLTPVMFVVLLSIAIPSETFPALARGLDDLAQKQGLGLGLLIVLFPGAIAFCMTSAEFALLKRTSVVTLSVCGIFKEVLTITAAGVIFGDELTPINISGLLVTILAIAVYNYTRMRRMKRIEISRARDGGSEPLSSAHPATPPSESAAAGSSRRGHHGTSIDVDAVAAASVDEQVPMLGAPAAAPVREYEDPRVTPLKTSATDEDNDNDNDAQDDVVMIPGRQSTTDADGDDSIHSPRRTFFSRRNDGYAAL